ncbi:transcription initiation at TATA-containing promoter protein, partial [Coemansia helicoidea]
MAGTKRRRTSAAAGAQPAEPAQPEPAHPERPPAGDSFLITAGTYERILYGIEARFAGSQLVLSPQFIFPSHIGCIKAVAAGGRYLASGSTDEIVKVYDLKKR